MGSINTKYPYISGAATEQTLHINLSLRHINATSAAFSWRVADAVASFQLTLTTVHRGLPWSHMVTMKAPRRCRGHTLHHLIPNQEYIVTIVSRSSDGRMNVSDEMRFRTLAGEQGWKPKTASQAVFIVYSTPRESCNPRFQKNITYYFSQIRPIFF